jgi:PPOX class probable F420-dependent enzyme
MNIPPVLEGQKYLSLATFRRNGVPVYTPVWFGVDGDKLHVMTRRDSSKYKRLYSSPRVRVAPCTMSGKITGPVFSATVRVLPEEDWPRAQKSLQRKYWLTRVPFLWSSKNVYLEIALQSAPSDC